MSAGPKTRWSREELERARQIARECLKLAPSVSPDRDFSARETPAPVQFGSLFRSAAVCSRFRMEELEETGSDRAEVERLREISISLRERAGLGWRTLSPETRNAVLKEMSAAAIAATIERRADSDDPLQKALCAALQGIHPDDLLKARERRDRGARADS